MPTGIYARLSLSERFLSKIKVLENSCWQWTGWLSCHGYGNFWDGSTTRRASRFAYEFFNDTTIPEGLQIDHLCRNRACVNPAHLEAVTQRVNIFRGIGVAVIHARTTQCPQGHPYNFENTAMNKGKRYCRICHREKELKRYHRGHTFTPRL